MVDAHDNETYTAQDSRLIWIDCEMTGLDIFHDELVEISVVPTDFDLNVLDEGIDYVIKPSQTAVDQMNDFVRRMHTHSGLINEWEHGLDVSEAEAKVIEYVRRFTPKGVRPLLAGNSVGSDKKFLDRYMPGLMESGLNMVWVDAEEGSFAAPATINVVKGCQNPELAQLFVEYMISDETQSKVAEAMNEAPVNKNATMPDELKTYLAFGEDAMSSLKEFDETYISQAKEEWIDTFQRTVAVQ